MEEPYFRMFPLFPKLKTVFMDQVTAQLLTQFVQELFKLNNKTVKNTKVQGIKYFGLY